MRGSRPGSLKLGQQGTVKENGDITHLMMGGGGGNVGTNTNHRADDFDIKMIQQRKQQAEIKRYERNSLTLSQMTNLRLFQTEGVCRVQFQIC